MPFSVLLGIVFLLGGIFIYLWIDAGKKSDIEKLTKTINDFIKLIKRKEGWDDDDTNDK